MGFFASLLDLFFPPRCIFCRSFLKKSGPVMCPDCEKTLPFLFGAEGRTSGDFFEMCVSPLKYEGSVRKAIHRFKFRGAAGYAECFGVILADCIRDTLPDRYDIISWVPLSGTRLRSRGYDQAFLLAQAAALALDDLAAETLVRHTDSKAQSSLRDSSERRANVMGAYAVPDPEIVAGKRILLIDDVVTTGSTLSECARTLLMAGAESVVCAALAKAGRV